MAAKKRPDTYKIWSGIKQRCFNQKCTAYKYYGARGITMFEPWINNFSLFDLYVGDRPTKKHTIDRIDNNGNYEPGNVRWATYKIQANNRSNNVVVDIEDRKLTVAALCDETLINRGTIMNWIKKGISGEEISRRQTRTSIRRQYLISQGLTLEQANELDKNLEKIKQYEEKQQCHY